MSNSYFFDPHTGSWKKNDGTTTPTSETFASWQERTGYDSRVLVTDSDQVVHALDPDIDGDDTEGAYVPITESNANRLSGHVQHFATLTEDGEVDWRSDTARIRVAAAKDSSPEKETAALERNRKDGTPVSLARAMNNQDVSNDDELVLDNASVQDYVAENPSNAIVSKGDLARMAQVFSQTTRSGLDAYKKYKDILYEHKRGVYTDEEVADLEAAGFSRVPGETNLWEKDGRIYRAPVLDKWLEPGYKIDRLSPRYHKGYYHVRGNELLPDQYPDYLRQLLREVAVLHELHDTHGDAWRQFSEEDLTAAVEKAASKLGMSEDHVYALTVGVKERFGLVSVFERPGVENAVNVFGAVDVAKAVLSKSPEELLDIAKNPQNYGDAALLDAIKYFERQAQDLRGFTWSQQVVSGAFASMPFMLEFAAFGGGSVARKGLSWGTRLGIAGKSTGKMFLAGVPGRQALAMMQAAQPHLTVGADIQTGVIFPTLVEAEDNAPMVVLVNETIRSTTDIATEFVGAFLPGTKVVSRFAPKWLAKSTLGKWLAKAGRSKAVRALDRNAKKFGFNGFVAEVGEEKLADFVISATTNAAQAIGTPYGDLGEDKFFKGWRDESVMLGVVAVSAGTSHILALPSSLADRWNARRFGDDLRKLQTAVSNTETKNRDVVTVEQAVRSRLGDKGVAFIAAEDANALFQSTPEVMETIGIDAESVRKAEADGRIIPVDVAAVVTRLEGDAFDRVVQELMPSPEKPLRVKDVEPVVKDAFSETGLENAEREVSQRVAERTQKELAAVAPEKIHSVIQNLPSDILGIDAELLRRFIQDPASVSEYDPNAMAIALQSVYMSYRMTDPGATALFQSETPSADMETDATTAETPDTLNVPENGGSASDDVALVRETMREDAAARKETANAYREALKQMSQLGRPAHEIRAAARLLSMADYFAKHTTSGMTAAEWIRGVAFQKMKEADWLDKFNGGKDTEARRGVTTFNDNWEAMITVFEGAADGSTLVHEIGHYAFETMRHFVESGIADERMVEDFRVLEKWAKLTEKEATTGYDKYLTGLKEKHPNATALSREEWTSREEKERLARGLEAYVMGGKAPSVEVTGAFATLRRILTSVYRYVKALGVKLSDDVRQVFDGMLATDETLERDSLVREALSGINKELLGLTQEEIKVYSDLIGKANDQALQELIAEKNRQLKDLRKQWRAEADAYMKSEPVYQALAAIQEEGGLDYSELVKEFGESTAEAFRKKGLTSAKAKSGKSIYTFWREAGFQSLEHMGVGLMDYVSPSQFKKDYMAIAEESFNAEFEASEAAQATIATTELMEKLVENLATKVGKNGREDFILRRAAMRAAISADINRMSVNQVMSDKRFLGSSRMNIRALTKALTKGDYISALDVAQKLRYNIELMRQKGDAQRVIRGLRRLVERDARAKQGATIQGEYQDAILDIAIRFGFPKGGVRRKPLHSAKEVVEAFNAVNNNALEVPAAMLTDSVPYGRISFGDIVQMYNLVQFLDGEGRAILSAGRQERHQAIGGIVSDSVASLKEQDHKFVKGETSIASVANAIGTWGTKLRNLLDKAGEWNPDSVFRQRMYHPMTVAASEQDALMAEPIRIIGEALASLHERSKTWSLSDLAGIRFGEAAEAEGYLKWDAEKLLMVCLNMGTLTNRKRLKSGFGWSEEQLSAIASTLSEADWGDVQKIWDAIGKGTLSQRVRDTFKKVYHFDMRQEDAAAFSVSTRSGTFEVQGGYFPLAYLTPSAFSKVGGESTQQSSTLHRATFTYDRIDNVTRPVDLSLVRLHRHVYDTSHFATHFELMRNLLTVIKNADFRREFGQTQGFARYDALVKLMENVAAPGEWMKGQVSAVERIARASFTAASLWLNPSVVIRQLSSFTVGTNELGRYYTDALLEVAGSPMETRQLIVSKSGMMRNRANSMDIDIRGAAAQFAEGITAKAGKALKHAENVGYKPMQIVDSLVAAPLWLAAYRKAIDTGASETDAVAAADEMVAKSQGANRPIDLSPAQLTSVGRGLSVFLSAASAVSTMGIKEVDKVLHGKGSFGGVVACLLAPAFLEGLVSMLLEGSDDDDPDRAYRTFWREVVSSPFSGIPYIRNVVDYAGGVIADTQRKTSGIDVFEVPWLRNMGKSTTALFEAVGAAADENPERATYKLAEVLGILLRVPIVTAYDRIQRQLTRWGAEDALPDIDEETKDKRDVWEPRSRKWEKR